jgi:nucleotide-binding universal stress UspA family protein
MTLCGEPGWQDAGTSEAVPEVTMSRITSSTIVVGVDGSTSARTALAWAVDAARRRHSRLRLVHAVEIASPGRTSPGLKPPAHGERDLAWSVLTAAIADLDGLDVTVESHLGVGRPAPVILDQARDALMIVVGSRGRSDLAGLLTGSTSLQVSMHAPCPVVVVRDGVPENLHGRSTGRVVVGVDGSEVSESAIGFAFEEADIREVGLTAVHAWRWSDQATHFPHLVWEDAQEEEQALLAQRLAGWGEKYPRVHVVQRTRRSDPALALIAESAGAALTVVGTRGSGGFKGLLLGSVSHAVLQCAYSPVAVVRTIGAES